MTKYDYKNSMQIKVRIEEIKRLWKEDIKKPNGGGLGSKINMELINLKIMLENMDGNKQKVQD